jgi:hypothetical protein
MTVVVRSESADVGLKAATIIIVVIALVLIVIVLLLYFLIPYLQKKNSNSSGATCTVAPSAPTNVSGVASSNTVTVSWTGTSNTDSYNVYVSKQPSVNKGTADRVVPSSTTSVQVINLVPITYYFAVTSVNSCGESSLSSTVSVTVTTWPTRIQICKADNPLICLVVPQVTNQAVSVTMSCTNQACYIDYVNQQHIAAYPSDSYCLTDNLVTNPTIEGSVLSEPCVAGNTTQNWAINLQTGFIQDTAQGLCLGADSVAESFAYNTTCTEISNPTDSRYVWTVQPV